MLINGCVLTKYYVFDYTIVNRNNYENYFHDQDFKKYNIS